MGYLLPTDYTEIIYTTIENKLSPDLIRDFLFNQWELHKKDNPNFLIQLGELILFIEKEQDGLLNNHSKALNISKEHSKKLILGYRLLIDKVENVKENVEERTAKKSIKIIWEGTQSQLYYEFRVLKEKELILNNYDEIAEFIKENFTGFENTKLSTMRTSIKRKISIVKPKRIQKPDEI